MNQGATSSVSQTTVQRTLLRLRSRRVVHAPMMTVVHGNEGWNLLASTKTGHPVIGDSKGIAAAVLPVSMILGPQAIWAPKCVTTVH
ncbi:hypothetical protein TNCV_4376501 [Trichonephila clavipes]|nr:hypothetical protein TNCV_4376501 [Trichonephila clavipes]